MNIAESGKESIMPDVKSKVEQVDTLVKTFRTHYAQYSGTSYNETELRIEFVNPFFQALGWDINNERGLPQHLREVKHEANVIVEEGGKSRKKHPDYSFRAGTEQCFFLETKKPSVDVRTATEPAFQLRRYGWSGNLTVSILTNFTDLVIFDCSIRPLEEDPASKAVVARYHYSEYVEKFEEIYNLISKEAVSTGEFSKTFSNIESSFMKEPFDGYFLDQIKLWRNLLSQDILDNNEKISAESLSLIVQRILNRIVFLRICEDRSFEQYETIGKITTYMQLRELFIAADKKYDSGLFEFIDEQELSISDSLLVDIFKDLYYPNSSYEFSVVDPYIIGKIYESFLTETIMISDEQKVKVIQKPEAVDSQGAVPTPKNITDFIVEETLSQLFSHQSLDVVADYCIADICCGSGNFLLSIFEYIVNFYIEYLRHNELDSSLHRGILYEVADCSDLRLSFTYKRQILEKNIFGVDIDPLAVEVAKLSLFIKLLENVTTDELNEYVSINYQRVLPNLDRNIKCGNSLIDSRYIKYNSEVLTNTELLSRINMFDWHAEFDGMRFNAIVGNPPYIRVQKMVHYSPEEYNYYKESNASGYETAIASLLDKYYLFIERGLSLLTQTGSMGYIIPHRFMNTGSGETLREWLSSRNAVKRITHFGTHQVFINRLTYTCVLVLTAGMQDTFEIGFVRDWYKFLFDHSTIYERYQSNSLGKEPWIFIPPSIKEALSVVESCCDRLDAITEIFVGLQTSADQIYIITPDKEDEDNVYFTDNNGYQQVVEKGILRKSIYDCQISKYEPIQHNSYLIFPYKYLNGKPTILTKKEIKTNYPQAYKYLKANKDSLAERSMPRRTEENWFAYGRSQSLRRFYSGERLVWPVLSIGSNYVYDKEAITFTGGGNGPFYGLQMKANTPESIFYVQAILNYWLMECLVKQKATKHRDDYYSHGKQFIASLPVYRIDFSDAKETKKYNDIVAGVKNIMALNVQKRDAKTHQQKEMLDRAITATIKLIENILDSFYGITEGERVDL